MLPQRVAKVRSFEPRCESFGGARHCDRPPRSTFSATQHLVTSRQGKRRANNLRPWRTTRSLLSFCDSFSRANFQGRDLSTLLEAMSPLVLASELAWGESDRDANDASDASAIEAAADGEGLSPAALRPLSRMSEEEKQVLQYV